MPDTFTLPTIPTAPVTPAVLVTVPPEFTVMVLALVLLFPPPTTAMAAPVPAPPDTVPAMVIFTVAAVHDIPHVTPVVCARMP